MLVSLASLHSQRRLYMTPSPELVNCMPFKKQHEYMGIFEVYPVLIYLIGWSSTLAHPLAKMVGTSKKPFINKEVPKRSRAFSTRAKTGCKTCKVRHVKCDEGRPGCRKCFQTGRKCDGYAHCAPAPNPKSSTISSAMVSNSFNGITYQTAPTIPDFLSPSLSVSDREQHSFNFFHTRSAPQLGSCFGSKFWNHFVLQASHHEPAVRHAAIALGSLHERFELEDKFLSKVTGDTEENSFALKQYVRAISCLVQPNMSVNTKHTCKSANVALTACILFICFETLRGHHDSALAHIDGGVKIFSELQVSGEPKAIPIEDPPEDHIPVSIFRVLFSRLDTQASVLNSRARIIDGGSDSLPNSIPDKFLNVEQAREALESIWTFGGRNLLSCSMYNGVPLPLPTSKEAKILLLSRLESWNRIFELYSCTTNKTNCIRSANPMEKRARSLLRMHKTMTQILVTTSTTYPIASKEPNELLWDKFQLEFEAMVRWASEFIYMPPNLRREGRKAASFTLDNEILQPLFLVATKCRHRSIRNKAILLLKQADRQEGLWNSLLSAKVAERIRDIEEAGLSEGMEIIPESNRLRIITMKFEFDGCHGRRAWLAYLSPSMYESGEWVQLYEGDTPSETV
ncbi:8c8647b3-1978-4f7f-8574-6262850a9fba [Sclerotinia trifoliorum]|uniref:8c8647b3-1978-4f7f-8574-6262850a9fba n=1 Tax=Sclerotinia trifoliorum TaxID=28548 RepID=A0A8H2VS60_9HELO|nr:8c8647b3-1978-4f7f-8574-6262850a9fba [Sclerotinia trifoliorum]